MATPLLFQLAQGNSTTSPTSAALGSNSVKANAIIVSIAIVPSTATVTGVTDSLSTFYGSMGSSSGSSIAIAQYLGFIPSTGANTISVATTGSPTAIVIEVREYGPYQATAVQSTGGYIAYRDPNSQAVSSTTTNTPSASLSPASGGTIVIGCCANNSSATYSLGASYSNLDTATQGTLVMSTEDKHVNSPGSSNITFTQSASVACIAFGVGFKNFLSPTLNNYQFVKVGDGMSCSEKIR